MNDASLENAVSTEEWQLRVHLAALLPARGDVRWTDLHFTHISARVPGPNIIS